MDSVRSRLLAPAARRTGGLLVGAVLISLLAAATAGDLRGEVVYFSGYGLVCGAAWWAALRPAGPDGRRPWLWLAAAQSLWLIGDLVYSILYWMFPTVDPTGLIDAPWLAGYAAIVVAIMMMARRRARGQLREPLLDMLTLTSAVALGMWQILVVPALQEAGGLYTAGIWLDAGYAVGDVLIAAAVLLLALSPGTRTAPTRLLITAACIRLLTDVGYATLPALIDPGDLARLAGVVLLGNALMVIVALHPQRAELTHPGRRMRTLHPARVFFLGLALLTAPTVAVIHGSAATGERIALLLATIAASGFVLARFTGAVRQQERAERLLAYQAAYDPLTGLANRRTLTAHLEDYTSGQAVFYLDLDGFKAVNDTHGHEAGDALLVEIASRLRAAAGAGDLIARLGGDEFVVLHPEALDRHDLITRAERLLQSIAEPITYHGRELRVGASVGIAVRTADPTAGPTAGIAAGELLRAADTAMYEAKRAGRGRWVLAVPPPPNLSLAG
ncbi:hypothetical protein GCM10010156_30120 [Planobispora rosea]|uniref:GGDEF domain-containing protein n=2 Tax=Planobispora rosea TaxID=35762 RepID=UPI0016709FEC|nr:GGDEF domain-containing protein [Planobispora rosea]GGS69141.1 hypothetical protein GCM10010156_30120 [Planobispora rosea]